MSNPTGKNSVAISGSHNTVSIGHIGDVTINQAPAPKLELISSEQKHNADGSYTTTLIVGVVSPYSPSRMTIVARAPTITGINIMTDGTGKMSNKQTGIGDGFGVAAVSSQSKRFRLTVNTNAPADILLEPTFE
jgi:hypothetical protein